MEGFKILWWVCLSVCLFFGCWFICLSAHIAGKAHNWTSPNVSACCLWPWLGHSLAALRYVRCFRFRGWQHWATEPEMSTILCSGACQVKVPVERKTTTVHQNPAIWAKSAMYDLHALTAVDWFIRHVATIIKTVTEKDWCLDTAAIVVTCKLVLTACYTVKMKTLPQNR